MIQASTETETFINQYNNGIKRGFFKNQKELVRLLNWNQSALSSVLAGRRNIPVAKSLKFGRLFEKWEEESYTIGKYGRDIKEMINVATIIEDNEPSLNRFEVLQLAISIMMFQRK